MCRYEPSQNVKNMDFLKLFWKLQMNILDHEKRSPGDIFDLFKLISLRCHSCAPPHAHSLRVLKNCLAASYKHKANIDCWWAGNGALRASIDVSANVTTVSDGSQVCTGQSNPKQRRVLRTVGRSRKLKQDLLPELQIL